MSAPLLVQFRHDPQEARRERVDHPAGGYFPGPHGPCNAVSVCCVCITLVLVERRPDSTRPTLERPVEGDVDVLLSCGGIGLSIIGCARKHARTLQRIADLRCIMAMGG